MAQNIENREKSTVAKREEEILEFWRENRIFEKSLEKDSPQGEFIFYDGPPFATGLPHVGHMLPFTMKDSIPRFKTMQGYHVPRQWGWDCHGLPIENLIEKELGLKNKKDIEEYGIEKFNAAARASVLRYDADWKRIIPRSGRWIDMDHAYLTMDPSYSESIWWSFKTLHDKKLIYQGFKVMPYCPHDGTTLSNFEVAQGYKDIADISAYVKFELEESFSTGSTQAKTYVLAWTTTPWTLPGNVALAVNAEIQYLKVKWGDEFFILAKERLEILKDTQYEAVEEFSGKELLGKKYKPVFEYYKDTELKNKENIWKIVPADFVTTTDGTGVVHVAPAFGEDDYTLSLKEKLPFIQHVDTEGKFKKEVTDFAGMSVKPKATKEDPVAYQKGDIEIIKYLAHHNLLLKKEKIVHSYPHCWRCDTPLLNYATSSWFVEVTKIKDKLVEENKKVKWVPEEIGEGRFGKWLENARDWAISRSRFWGAPLPVWICKECQKVHVSGSVQDIKQQTKRNNYVVMRHGEADLNVTSIVSSKFDAPYHLTVKGKQQSQEAANNLKDKKIDIIISSDFVRTRETAKIMAQNMGIPESEIIYDKRLRELNFGEYEGKPLEDWVAYRDASFKGDYSIRTHGGESADDVQSRVGEFLYEIDQTYQGKNILIVSHQTPVWYLYLIASGLNRSAFSPEDRDTYRFYNAETRVLDFAFIPHNRKYELDLHRPYIDEVKWSCECGGEFRRVPEVFDTWYESGSMPYATNATIPADFIAEGQDQTRGWFYSLLVLSTGLFNKSPYKNVLVNGIILAEDGQKMSKRLKNYPELEVVFDKYGADALRYFLLSSPAVKAEDVAFSEKGLDEVIKKITMRLLNVYTFYATYSSTEHPDFAQSNVTNVLDLWILARLSEVNREITESLEHYKLDKAARPFMQFIDDLSTWYLRRSRDRFKGEDEKDKQNALATTHYVLFELSKLVAPFMPFLAEDIYQKVKGQKSLESVHLESWPEFKKLSKQEEKILEEMQQVRDIVSKSLEARVKAAIKVRQPLQKITVSKKFEPEFLELIKDELNIKEVVFDSKLTVSEVLLDTTLTETLKEEGQAREFIRALQELRKAAKLNPTDIISISISTSEEGKRLIEKFKQEITKTALIKSIEYQENEGKSITVENLIFKIVF